ncbi:uncharacterized protein LOC116286486 [Actinia tenebrosa]|uniref:Uncharacterized protein LOC116286486 n=1 Tax=Actinia tenebrosa TaxID=6105 RepID=A0A6P8GX84_ACTTE|nr:uncharacterized protein LOC116286486 [Actinia tenebrosa]
MDAVIPADAFERARTSIFYASSAEVVQSLVSAGASVNAIDNIGTTPLIYAIRNSITNVGGIRALIDAGADVNYSDNDKKTALFYAVDFDDVNMAALLINAGADVNRTDSEGQTPLFYALSRNMVILLVNNGAKVNETNNEGKTALHCAVINDKELQFSALVDVGAHVNAKDKEGKTALFYLRGTQTITRLLINAGADINMRDKKGYTALSYSVKEHRAAVVTDLIDAGADVTIADNEDKTALFYAVDNKDLVLKLVGNGKSQVNARDIYGRTPLFYAFTKSLEIARWLLAKGALLHITDNCHLSILSFYIHNHFCHLGRSSILKGTQLFIRHGILQEQVFQAVIDTLFCKVLSSLSASYSISEALQFAIENMDLNSKCTYNRHVIRQMLETVKKETNENKDLVKRWESLVPKILRFLKNLGANPNSVDSDGNTALHYATRLPYIGISQTTVMNICLLLKILGVSFNVKNHQNETPLLYCLSGDAYDIASPQQKLPAIQNVVRVCSFLLKNGARVEEISRAGESVFHLILKICHHGLTLFHVEFEKSIPKETEKVLELIVQAKLCNDGFTVNRRNTNLISPLHLWASLKYNALAVDPIGANASTSKDESFENYLQRIFQLLLKCNAKLNDRNIDDETPLHLCRSWTAAKLLLDAGANPNDLDSLRRTPLLVAARNLKFLRTPDRLYPDVLLEPKAFWNLVLEKGLDPWAVDKNGESVMSVLVKSEAFALAEALLDVACETNFIQSPSIAVSLLNAVCKDESPRALWKSILVEKILKSSKSYLLGKETQDTPLHLCCRNIVREPGNLLGRTSAHWTIAKQLLSVGADCRIADTSGLSCLDIAKSCPELQDLLLKPVEVIQLLIPWMSVSTTYQLQLAKVARRQECEQVGQFWYHRSHLASGSFGFVFAGINEKDGREVAIKRIEKLRLQRPEDQREISNLTALADCEQVVRYLSFYDDDHFSYVILELMEGNLEEYFDSCIFDLEKLIGLCLDVVKGLKYLHDNDVLHRDLKPSNILYKTHPKLCLKIADFGLSRRMDSTGSFSVYSTNVGTKCWIAPEVLKSSKDYSKPSDIFSCGLLLHYILTVKKHPFAAAAVEGSKPVSLLQTHETQSNVINNKMEGWDDSICPEARHLVKKMLDVDVIRRPTATDTSDHPLFWPKKKKIDLLSSVANQPEFECPRAKRPLPLTEIEADFDSIFSVIVVHPTWDDPAYLHMPVIYAEMMKKRKTPYDTSSVIGLVRFMRNAISHVSEDKRPTPIRKQLLEDFVFLEYFPNLAIEVFEAVTKHKWDQTREEIKYAMNK